MRFDWLWPMGVWQTGNAGRLVSRTNPAWQESFRELLPDVQAGDISGSPFAITRYVVDERLGGAAALTRLRQRMMKRNLRLLLDFVPNHTARDHHWLTEHPEYYIEGNESDLANFPESYGRAGSDLSGDVFAYGRDPYFPAWPDTFQLNYGHADLRNAMAQELISVAAQCDGVRCDMAMLILPEIFQRTWSIPSTAFWPEAIQRTRAASPRFVFMAEVYWDLEWRLQQEGFDYTYDKRLYDRLEEGNARSIREHLFADMEFQRKCARFLENHDEPRAAAVFPLAKHRAAAAVTFLTPGLRFFHQGQMEGFRKRVSIHLSRKAIEPVDREIQDFYQRLMPIVGTGEIRNGDWSLLDCRGAWEGNPTHDSFLCFSWHRSGRRILISVNYAPTQGQCYVKLAFPEIAGRNVQLRDLLSSVVYDRSGNELIERGLYLDMPSWMVQVFDIVLT